MVLEDAAVTGVGVDDQFGVGEASGHVGGVFTGCLLYTSDAADERSSVDLGGRRFLKKKKKYQL